MQYFIAIARMEYHESWNTPDFDHDICIITLKEPLNLDDPNVQPIEFFQTGDAEIPAETVCNSTGWGLTSGGGLFLPNHLQWIQIPIHSAADCESIFPGYITENMVCAGSAGAATCNGDSGGPLVCPDENGVGKSNFNKKYLIITIIIRKIDWNCLIWIHWLYRCWSLCQGVSVHRLDHGEMG